MRIYGFLAVLLAAGLLVNFASACGCDTEISVVDINHVPDAEYRLWVNYDPGTENMTFVSLKKVDNVGDRSDSGLVNPWTAYPRGDAGMDYRYDSFKFVTPLFFGDKLYSFDGCTVTFDIPMITYKSWNTTSFDIYDPSGKLVLVVPISAATK